MTSVFSTPFVVHEYFCPVEFSNISLNNRQKLFGPTSCGVLEYGQLGKLMISKRHQISGGKVLRINVQNRHPGNPKDTFH